MGKLFVFVKKMNYCLNRATHLNINMYNLMWVLCKLTLSCIFYRKPQAMKKLRRENRGYQRSLTVTYSIFALSLKLKICFDYKIQVLSLFLWLLQIFLWHNCYVSFNGYTNTFFMHIDLNIDTSTWYEMFLHVEDNSKFISQY